MRKLALDEFTRFNYLSNGKFNADGSKYAYVVKNANVDDNSYSSNLYVYDLDNKLNKQITFSNKVGFYQWLNDNELIYIYMDGDKESSTLNAININGGESYLYKKIDKVINSFEIINQNLFIFASTNNIGEVIEGKDKDDYQIIDEIPFWSNGEGFTNKKRNSLFLMNLENDNISQISDKYSNVIQFEIKNNKIYFIADTFENKCSIYSEIYSYDISNNTLSSLLNDINHELYKLFIIEEKLYLFAVDTKTYGINENPALYKLIDGALQLVWSKDESISSNSGSDSKLGSGITCKSYDNNIYYTTLDRDMPVLKKYDISGNETVLIKGFTSLDFFDIFNDEIIFSATDGLSLQELYLLSDNKINRITSINDNILKDIEISPINHFTYINDGIDLDGYIIKPTNYDSNKLYPCILDIHGGPKTAYGRNYYHEMQLFANEGYFVVFCNPRGSDGRCNDFADIRGKYGTVDYDDIMKCLDTAIENNKNIDIEKLGVTGGSYGGFMTNWIIGHTNRFKAAVSQRSISNWFSMGNTTDIGYYFAEDQNACNAWNDPGKLWWHSPLKYADNVNTPTLFIHSDEDYRCWMAEGLQMFTALKYHGVESRLCLFKGETHELSRSGKPLHRIKRLQEMLNWFNKYLK